MANKTPKPLRAIAVRQLQLTRARPDQARDLKAFAALSQLTNKAQPELFQQSDLMHVEAVLVTEGLNDNDDAFVRDQLKKAISSPILKPMNWQHKDEKILGAMYAVEARDLEGNTLGEIGDEPVELIIQGVVWHHLPHIKTTAEEIVSRIEKGDLFVSMECWFDSFDYGLYNSSGELYDLIPRNNDTAFLDGYLRANGGVGRYNGMRIGRALSGINFGGIAFVDRPANKRSFILNQFVFDPTNFALEAEEIGANQDGLDQDQVVTNNVVSDVNPSMEVNMNDLNRAAASKDQVQEAVANALAAQEQARAQEQTKADLDTANGNVAELQRKLEASEAQVAQLRSAIDRAFDSAKAGATTSTPEEIAKIDRAIEANSGDAVWNAKIDWVESSRASVSDKLKESEKAGANEKLVEENVLLKKELATLKNEIREAEIKYIFAELLDMNEDEVKTFVEAGLSLETDEAYGKWLDEKKLFAKKLMELKMKKDKEDKEKKKKASEDTEAGLLEPSQRETPIDDLGAVLRSRHGSAPADMARTPRSKLTAAADLDEMFEEVDEPNLAGARTAEGNADSPMGKLVANLLPRKSHEDDN